MQEIKEQHLSSAVLDIDSYNISHKSTPFSEIWKGKTLIDRFGRKKRKGVWIVHVNHQTENKKEEWEIERFGWLTL